MTRRPGDAPAVRLRAVEESDIEVFFTQQADLQAAEMAAFPSRTRDEHFAHWRKILAHPTGVIQTIVVGNEVAGNIVSWTQDDHQEVGYWIGNEHWGRGIASAALSAFLELVEERPLYAWVARGNAGSIRVLEKNGFGFEREDGEHFVYVHR